MTAGRSADQRPRAGFPDRFSTSPTPPPAPWAPSAAASSRPDDGAPQQLNVSAGISPAADAAVPTDDLSSSVSWAALGHCRLPSWLTVATAGAGATAAGPGDRRVRRGKPARPPPQDGRRPAMTGGSSVGSRPSDRADPASTPVPYRRSCRSEPARFATSPSRSRATPRRCSRGPGARRGASRVHRAPSRGTRPLPLRRQVGRD